MGNTGRKIILTLKEEFVFNGAPTGNTKPNTIGDPDYIAPIANSSDCPVTSDLACPSVVATYKSFDGVLYKFEVEYSIPASVRNNPMVDRMVLSFNANGDPANSVKYYIYFPTGSYGHVEYSVGQGATNYTIQAYYIDNTNVVLKDCGDVATGLSTP
jgi:hypothetical protein